MKSCFGITCMHCEKKAMCSTYQSLKKHHFGGDILKKAKEQRELGRIMAMSITCKVCGKPFMMERPEIRWYSRMGYPLPKRCPECRAKRRKEREKNEKKIKNAHASQSE